MYSCRGSLVLSTSLIQKPFLKRTLLLPPTPFFKWKNLLFYTTLLLLQEGFREVRRQVLCQTLFSGEGKPRTQKRERLHKTFRLRVLPHCPFFHFSVSLFLCLFLQKIYISLWAVWSGFCHPPRPQSACLATPSTPQSTPCPITTSITISRAEITS